MARILQSFLVLALALALAGPGAAQDEAEPDYTDFNLDELMGMDVVYGATRYQQKVSDAPAAVTVITGEEIRAYGYRTLGSVLASVRGFYTTYDRSYQYFGVRGFSRPGDYNTRVLILHDGHAVSDVVYNQASASAELEVDLDLIQRIEVIRGPGSSLYGAGAFFAVINIVTLDGSDLEGLEVMGEAGSLDRFGGRLSWGRSLGADGSVLLSGSGFDFRGENLYWPEYDDPSTNNGVFENGDAEDAVHFLGKVRKGGLSAAGGYSDRGKHVPTGEWDMLFNDNGAVFSDSRLFLDLALERELGPGRQFKAHLAFDRYVFRGNYPYDYAEAGEPELRVLFKDLTDGRWISGDFQFSGEWTRRHRLVAGGDFRKALMARQKAWDPDAIYLDIDKSVDNAGAYAQDEISLGRGLSLYAGMRFDTYTSFGHLATPRAGLVTRPTAGTTVKILYGEAFRAPNTYELYYHDDGAQKGNADLTPEHIRTWELVCAQQLTTRVNGSISLFSNSIRDLIDQVIDPEDELITFANAGKVTTKGAEVELDGRLLAGLRGRAGYSYQTTEDAHTGERLTNSPEHVVQLNVTTPQYARILGGGLEMQYVSARRTLSGGSVDPYLVSNLTLMCNPGIRDLRFDVSVYNLFDEKFSDPGAEHQRQEAITREGRCLVARLAYRW